MSPSLLPIVSWLSRYKASDLHSDLVAGLTTAVLIIPQAMGYAMLAGLPPVVGLYASLTPLLAYAVLGTSQKLSIGPAAMDSLLVAVAVSAIAESGSNNYIAVAATLGVLVGGIQLLLGVLRLGFVANFLSRPVLSGFMSAAALIIAVSQLAPLLQLGGTKTHHVPLILFEALRKLSDVSFQVWLLAAGTLIALVTMKRWLPKWPRGLMVVAATTALAYGFNLEARGVAVVGEVQGGLPPFSLPSLELELWRKLLPSALTIALVAFTEAISIGKHLARGGNHEIRPNQELLALGVANVAGGLFGGYPVAGGLSRSAVNASAGARTQLAGVVTALIVALTLLFLMPLFHYLPKAALAAIILTAAIGLFDVREPRRLWRIERLDLLLLVFTFVATLSLGIQWGIALGVLSSLLLFVVRTTRPHFAVLGKVPGTEAYLNIERHPHAQQAPFVIVVRLDAQLYFGNVSFLKETLKKLEREHEGALKAVVLDASGVNQLDSSAEAALCEIDRDYTERGIQLLFARVKGPVRDVMYRSGLLTRLDAEGRIFFRTHDAVRHASCESSPLPRKPRPEEDRRAPADRIGCGSMAPAPSADSPCF